MIAVLQQLIQRYNETGIFIPIKTNVIWFNGKRFELFCNNNLVCEKFIYYKNVLYAKHAHCLGFYQLVGRNWKNAFFIHSFICT